PHVAELWRRLVALADEFQKYRAAASRDGPGNGGAGRVQYAEHAKFVVQPAAKFDNATELALVSDTAHNPRFAQHPALLVEGGVAEIAILPRPIGLQGKISFATSRAGPAAIDGCLLAALHREEHLFDPTVLKKRANLVDDLCAHARALHRVRGSPRGA